MSRFLDNLIDEVIDESIRVFKEFGFSKEDLYRYGVADLMLNYHIYDEVGGPHPYMDFASYIRENVLKSFKPSRREIRYAFDEIINIIKYRNYEKSGDAFNFIAKYAKMMNISGIDFYDDLFDLDRRTQVELRFRESPRL